MTAPSIRHCGHLGRVDVLASQRTDSSPGDRRQVR